MLNVLWAGMIILGIAVGTATGNIQAVSAAFIDSARDAVELCVTMLGVMAMWTGILKVAEDAGLLHKMSQWMAPMIRFLFPEIPEDHPSRQYIATNFAANILGLGWAATPAGLKAMEHLGDLKHERDLRWKGHLPKHQWEQRSSMASNEMCAFLIMNISSLQLIPVNIIAYRSQYGSPNPSIIVGPAIVATAVSTGIAVLFCKVMDKRQGV